MDKEQDYALIRKFLKRSEHAIDIDKKIFEQWQLGKISLQECMNTFLKNNDIPRKIQKDINEEYFTGWLNSIGYKNELQDI